MKYIVNNKEVSRDTFYFCKRAKEENKTFVLLTPNNDVHSYINYHPEYDYFIVDEISTYCTKGEATTNEWFEKEYDSWSKCTPEDMTKRYQKSKFKDTMTFKEWYTKNGWTLKSETKYPTKSHDVPAAGYHMETNIETKSFSITVRNDDTVKTINELRDKYGEYCIEYVLRDNTFTEIIYKDTYIEI